MPRQISRVFIPAIAALCVVATSILPIAAGAQSMPQLGDSCQAALGAQACANLANAGPAHPASGLYVAVAASTSTVNAGVSHGQPTQAGAEQAALAECKATGATDCKVQRSAQNSCIGYAINITRGATSTSTIMGLSTNPIRAFAAAGAIKICESLLNNQCSILATPCSNDDLRWPSPLPLPTGGQPGSVDPNLVGTWALTVPGGRWVWQIGSNGMYEVHSEAMDGVASNIGTFVATAGRYTLHATNLTWDDTGIYTFQPPSSFVGTGRLGTGTWVKIPADDE